MERIEVCTIVEYVSSFASLREVSDAFTAGMAVYVEVEPDRHLLRRTVDFLAGLALGADASLERVGPSTYLITPAVACSASPSVDRPTEPEEFDTPLELLDKLAATG